MERDVCDVFMCSEIKNEQYEIWFNLNGADFVRVHANKLWLSLKTNRKINRLLE